MAGTQGQALRVEALEIILEGTDAGKYSVEYQAYVQNEGWQAWASDGQIAGSFGKSQRIEVLRIIIVEKGNMYKPPTPIAVMPIVVVPENELERYINSKDIASVTSYFIWIDSPNQRVNVFKGSNKKWQLVVSMICSSGKASTPTIKGDFTVGIKGEYFIADGGARCKYYTEISGNYLFHSVLYDTKGNYIIDNTTIRPMRQIRVMQPMRPIRLIPPMRPRMQMGGGA